MNALTDAVTEYLVVRRAMGHKLERAEELLRQFAAHLDAVDATTVTVDEAVAWATAPVGAGKAWMGIRLGVVRSFATWLQARDPSAEVPPPDALGARGIRRAVPYLYTDAEIAALMQTAGRMSRGLQRHTFPALIGLLAVTGMFSRGRTPTSDRDLGMCPAQRPVLARRRLRHLRCRHLARRPQVVGRGALR